MPESVLGMVVPRWMSMMRAYGSVPQQRGSVRPTLVEGKECIECPVDRASHSLM